MSRTPLPLTLCLLTLAASGACQTAPRTSDTMRDYQVVMWVLHGVPGNGDLFFRRLREANVSAISISPWERPDMAREQGFAYYVENIHRIAFLHDKRPIYDADWNGYTRSRDRKFLVRKPCLHDPNYLEGAKQDIRGKVRRFASADQPPILYNLGDECSITSFASPMDYCFAPHTLDAFRSWLREHYGTLDALNAQWETAFAAWSEVLPMTTYEIKERERSDPSANSLSDSSRSPLAKREAPAKAKASARAGRENYSPWADHRTFMDITFSQSLDEFRRWLHDVDPDVPAGLEGTQMPAAFGGYDLWRLSQVLDWVEPYDIGNSHDMFRSFMPSGTPAYATLFEHDPHQASRRLWHLLLNGDTGVIIWCSSDWLDYQSPELTPRPFVAGMGDLFAELRGPAARAIMSAKRDPAPIAIHYSHPSIQVAWMLDSREDGDTWPRRFSSYEAVHSRIARNRDSWTKLIADLGLQYDFISTQQILDGVLEQRGYRALILPESLAMGDEEAAAIARYAGSGGAVIADFLPGVFDHHGKRRPSGVLDDLFGIRRTCDGMIEQPEQTAGPGFAVEGRTCSLGPAERDLSVHGGAVPGAGSDTAAVLVQRPVGDGSAHYLNISLIDYGKWRLEGKGGELLEIVGGMLARAGVQAAIKGARLRRRRAAGRL